MILYLIGTCLTMAAPGQQGEAAGVRVAVVNLATASERYVRTGDLESQFATLRTQMQQEGEGYRDRIEQKRRILSEQLKPGTDAFNAMSEELTILEARAQFFVETKTKELDRSLASSLQSIYEDIRRAVGEIAAEEGYQIVLAADELSPDKPESPTAAKQQILLQKVVYWNPGVDITEKVVSRLNARYGGRPVQSDAAPQNE